MRVEAIIYICKLCDKQTGKAGLRVAAKLASLTPKGCNLYSSANRESDCKEHTCQICNAPNKTCYQLRAYSFP